MWRVRRVREGEYTMICEMCGDPGHKTKDCKIKITIRCPVCGYGTYIHDSGVRACVNSFCSWVEESPLKGGK